MARAKRRSKAANAAEVPAPSPAGADALALTAEGFRESFGEDLQRALDLSTWQLGVDLDREYSRLEREVREAVRREGNLQRRIRRIVFPLLATAPAAPKGAGVHAASLEALAAIHRGLLFNGGVECVDGTVSVHDTLPLTIYQIGVTLVSYRGDQGSWCQRLFRRDLRRECRDPVEEVVQLLRSRSRRGALNHTDPGDPLGALVQRAIMDYAERAILGQHSRATWRMGHGNPISYPLLTGSSNLELMVAGTKVLRALIEGHQKFVFVSSEPRDRLLLSIGQALRPLEFAIVGTLKERLEDWFRQRRFAVGVESDLDWDGEQLSPAEWIPRFIDRVALQVVVGVFRATRLAPAQMFYAHVDHADVAAHIALADSVLQEHRGFPLLIDLADHVCRAVFGSSLKGLTESAYASVGVPWLYLSERSTRDR